MKFDPYHLWLGVPEDRRPISYYDLLGLTELESDPSVIRNALQRSEGYLRKRKTMEPQHAELANRLLRETAAAGQCLLDPAKRRKYDTTLSNHDFWDFVREKTVASQSALLRSQVASQRRRQRRLVMVLGAALAAVCVGAAVVLLGLAWSHHGRQIGQNDAALPAVRTAVVASSSTSGRPSPVGKTIVKPVAAIVRQPLPQIRFVDAVPPQAAGAVDD